MDKERVYLYDSKDKKGLKITVPYEFEREAAQALKDYEVAKKYVISQCLFTWRNSEKKYRLDTRDRANSKKLKHWQSNVTAGLSRTLIDVFQSSLSENPIVPTGSPIGDTPEEVVDNILMSLTFVADKSGFQRESKVILKNWLKTGQFAMRVGYMNKKKVQKYVTEVDGKPVEREVVRNSLSIPYCKNVDVWNVYPDPYRGLLRYNTERWVVSYTVLMDDFGALINSPFNKSPFKDPEFLKTLPLNKHASDFTDYGSITSEIYQQKNAKFNEMDSYKISGTAVNNNPVSSWLTQDQDTDVTNGLIEFLYYTSESQIVLHANGYPIYIGKNIFGFVPYVIQSATDETMRLGVEGIPYILSGIEETHDSFLNNLIDSARVTTVPRYIAQRWVFFNEEDVENAGPGDILWVETPALNGAKPIEMLQSGSATDNGLLELTQSMSNQKVGASEYNLGMSARERTATGANAVVNSDKKRLGPYIDSFINCVSQVMQMWLTLMIDNWTKEQYVSITGKNGEVTWKMLSNKDIAGDLIVSLDLDGLMSARNDINVKRLIEFFPQIVNTGLAENPGEVLAEILRWLGLNPARYKIGYDKPASKVEETAPVPEVNPANEIAQELAAASNPQLNLWNENAWQQPQ